MKMGNTRSLFHYDDGASATPSLAKTIWAAILY